MADPLDFTTCAGQDGRSDGAAVPPTDPFRALHVHYGMLLGVEDFEAIGAYHRGKGWLHNAWLHREGVVWGFGVSRSGRELRVDPGLALDAVGRELHLDVPACLDLAAWYDEHKSRDDLGATIDPLGAVTLHAHVVALFKVCPAREVPALAEPCNAGAGTAPSRLVETVELRLVPGLAPPPPAPPYHRLRLLFCIDAAQLDPLGIILPADQEVLTARASILALPHDQQPAATLVALRRFAALDAIDLRPAATSDDELQVWTPARPPAPLVLANIHDLRLVPLADGTWQVDTATVDPTIRSTHIATRTIQELLCGPCCDGAPAPTSTPVTSTIPEPPEVPEPPKVPEPGPEDEDDERITSEVDPALNDNVDPGPLRDATGKLLPQDPTPRLPGTRDPAVPPSIVSATLKPSSSGLILTIVADRPLAPASVTPAAFSLTAFDPNTGWRSLNFGLAVSSNHTQVTLSITTSPVPALVRLVIHGGPTPLLDADLRPLDDFTQTFTQEGA
ncbi:hypothetical protein [Nannocystis sp.]|uniref:hypothetical protein n=1 Tax=Nannocystis sp. TaxID=1962667 RepID=UPI0025E31D2B|nr:hypothetical protein [Nannocystis sp.]MBK7823653.1 hypothetical protein [Nannocystis sp.]